MNRPRLQILYEDNHLLAIVKPAGLATMGVPGDKPSLLVQAKEYVKRRYRKPGNVYLGVVSRLDAPVTGVVLMARTSKAARRLTEQFRGRQVEKVYWALVERTLRPAEGTCRDWLAEDPRHRRMHVVSVGNTQGKEAVLHYRRLAYIANHSLVEITLETGRKHQIRVQLAQRGCPILGDRKYGCSQRWAEGIALHARCLRLSHPVGGEPLELVAPLPGVWRKAGVQA